ncbi:alpha/beta hydrolase [Lysobacter sp. GX 14042]|uniref:alpha/beta hydrolase family protein n=1 Tax=Lysobacter sp. GX 14042 TaxID=2907155 RepID=UPI001F38BAB5|nr:alpha/beta hydrolase [Lysobacter sp. GX 14042]MCE7033120.1 alpha/beta hydrolase [Lysobacter sp. GX 14042]
MDTRLDSFELQVDGDAICATALSPATRLPGVLFVHGWNGTQRHDLVRAREVAGLGAVCLTFDLRGHEANEAQKETVTRGDNLQDLLVAYDWLAAHPEVDPGSIAVVGISYGGYLAAVLSALRPVRWLALRSPALYPDTGWDLPKVELHRIHDIAAFRSAAAEPSSNRALAACADYRGHALVVEAENDRIVPHAVLENYRRALAGARSLTSRVLPRADHALTGRTAQQAYTDVLVNWLTEMVVGTREASAAEQVAEHARQEKAAADPAPGPC